MHAGTVIAERFVIERRAGAGGTGTVYRALDQRSGQPVAIKVMHRSHGQRTERFVVEARALAELQHAAIVRYVTHGLTDDQEPYLAMEWLEGEDLSERLAREPLSVEESIALALRVAGALALAHTRGVVHRDVKPSNLFLPGGAVNDVKLLDFGVARMTLLTGSTRAGAMVGTPGYMAPEQARGAKGLDARADVFSLGCVLFECLTGRVAFVGEHVMAVLAKILLEEAPRVRELRSDVPAGLDALVARMLSKEAAGRPADGAEVARELSSLGAAGRPGSSHPPSVEAIFRAPTALTGGERRLLSIVLAGAALRASSTLMQTSVDELATMQKLETVVSAHGGRMEPLIDGSIVVTLTSTDAATDQAVRAARCALAVRAVIPHAPIALAMGRGELVSRWPAGEVIDKAARLLRAATLEASDADVARPIRIDDVTAGLLDPRFDLAGDATGLGLLGERDTAPRARTLLGRASPCVGRERELDALEAILEESREEPVARVALVTAPAGVGKSRLRHELLQRLASSEARTEVWLAQGDPMSAGAPFVLLAQALRSVAGIFEGEPLHVRQAKLRARVARHVAEKDVARVSEFLGEVVGTPFPDEASVQLRAARLDAMLMGDQMRRAWEDFVRAECCAPLLIVVEDLQWGDLPTVKFIDAVLKNLHDQPITVLALGRPEVEEIFPRVWAGRGVTELRLGPLTRRASEKLVTQALGGSAHGDVVARIVERGAGNAFYLEELVRSAADGEGDAPPETVLAMVHARLERLAPDARRVLRAASVFGQVSWDGGIAALLGQAVPSGELGDHLGALVDAEHLVSRSGRQFPGEKEYAFRHALVRDAAYAMLTDEDRVLGHKLAGEWLESAGATDATVLAEHFERGAHSEKAARWYRRSVEQALEGHDLAAVLNRAERAIACGAAGEELGALRVAQAHAHRWRGEFAEAARRGDDAMRALPPLSAPWLAAAGEVAVASSKLADVARLVALKDELLAPGLRASEESALVIAATRTATHLFYAGRADAGEELLARIDKLVERLEDPAVAAWASVARATRAEFSSDPALYLECTEAAANGFERAGDLRNACTQRLNVGYAHLEIGDFAEAERSLREAIAAAERMELWNLVFVAKHNLGLVLARRGAFDEAKKIETECIRAFDEQVDRRMSGASHMYLAKILRLAGDLGGAAVEARAALELLAKSPPAQVYALAILAEVHLAEGRATEALAVTKEAMERYDALGGVEEGESLLRLVHAEALDATGDRDAALGAIQLAKERLALRAGRIASGTRRETFLACITENARTLELARAWASA